MGNKVIAYFNNVARVIQSFDASSQKSFLSGVQALNHLIEKQKGLMERESMLFQDGRIAPEIYKCAAELDMTPLEMLGSIHDVCHLLASANANTDDEDWLPINNALIDLFSLEKRLLVDKERLRNHLQAISDGLDKRPDEFKVEEEILNGYVHLAHQSHTRTA